MAANPLAKYSTNPLATDPTNPLATDPTCRGKNRGCYPARNRDAMFHHLVPTGDRMLLPDLP